MIKLIFFDDLYNNIQIIAQLSKEFNTNYFFEFNNAKKIVKTKTILFIII